MKRKVMLSDGMKAFRLFYLHCSGGAGKVFRIKPRGVASTHERKISMPITLVDGDFGPNHEIINDIPDEKALAVKIIRRFRCGRDSIDKIRNEIKLIKNLQPKLSHDSTHLVPNAAAPLLVSVHEDPTQVAIVME